VEDTAGHSWGSGTIVDARSGEALIVTCGHLFREVRQSDREPAVLVELFELTSGGPQVAAMVSAQIISYDLNRDVGLVSIRIPRTVSVAPIAPPGAAVQPGDPVTSVGCGHGTAPDPWQTNITTVGRYLGPPNVQAKGAPVEGRSGGGLFNQRGELIGVCNCADPQGNEGLYAGLESIHAELDRIGLSEIYHRPAARQPVARPPVAAQQLADRGASEAPLDPFHEPTLVRGQDFEAVEPVPAPLNQRTATNEPNATANGPAAIGVADARPPGLNAVEQAAWDEIMKRTAESEVICIIRPREVGGQSEVITLDRVSPALVKVLKDHSTRFGTADSR
jgi:hypothetical protein